MDKEVVINRLKRTTERRYPNKPYTIKEYKNFYTVVADGTEPFLYEKENGFPIRATYGQLEEKELANPKVVFESGGKNNGKK